MSWGRVMREDLKDFFSFNVTLENETKGFLVALLGFPGLFSVAEPC